MTDYESEIKPEVGEKVRVLREYDIRYYKVNELFWEFPINIGSELVLIADCEFVENQKYAE